MGLGNLSEYLVPDIPEIGFPDFNLRLCTANLVGFAKAIKQFGAAELSKLIYKAKEIYDANKAALEKETTEEEFNALYVDFEVFDDLEEVYFDIEEQQTALIAAYVDEHISDFGQIVQN